MHIYHAKIHSWSDGSLSELKCPTSNGQMLIMLHAKGETDFVLNVSASTETRPWARQLGSFPGRGKGFLFLPPTSRLAWGPTQPPIQWVPGTHSHG
jgi:hypothetical protein